MRLRFLVLYASSFLLAAIALLLPWLEASYGLGLGFSTLGLFQVSYPYLECHKVEFAHQSFFWGDFSRASVGASIYLVAAQVFTYSIVFLITAVLVAIVHQVLVQKQLSTASARLGERK